METRLIFLLSLFLVLYFKTNTYSLSEFNFRFLELLSFLYCQFGPKLYSFILYCDL